jgi:DnaA family protein
MEQIPLAVRLPDGASFENFLPGRNAEALTALQRFVGGDEEPRLFYLYGQPGSGKTHLLHACLRARAPAGGLLAYRSCDGSGGVPPMLADIAGSGLVCLDDLDRIAGNPEGELALFALLERLRAGGGRAVLAAAVAVREAGFRLPDLASRLSAALAYGLKRLNDAETASALRERAAARGLVLGEEVVAYVLRRQPRDPRLLFAWLERVDRTSLATKRRVTLPFVQWLEKQERSS